MNRNSIAILATNKQTFLVAAVSRSKQISTTKIAKMSYNRPQTDTNTIEEVEALLTGVSTPIEIEHPFAFKRNTKNSSLNDLKSSQTTDMVENLETNLSYKMSTSKPSQENDTILNNTTQIVMETNSNFPQIPNLTDTNATKRVTTKFSTASVDRESCDSKASSNNGEETDVIGDLVGHFGKWQLMMTVLLSLFQVPNTFHISSSVYQAANKIFWCARPIHLRHMPVDIWRNVSNSHDNCFQSFTDWNSISNDTQQYSSEIVAHNSSRIPCSAWEYDTSDNVGNTWTSEWNLVCDKEYLKNVAEMFFLLGVATGGIISGYLSDKFGRKMMLFISCALQTIIGFALYFPNSFELYLILRALLGLVSVSVTYAGLILAIECVDGKWRTIAGMYNLFPLPLSYMMISGIAYLTQDYQKLQLCIGIPGIFLCFLVFVIPESPRWLLVKGRIAEVKKIVLAAAKFNGRQLPENFETMLKLPEQEESSQDIMCIFRSRYLRRITLCFLCIWFTINLVYYGLILNMSSFGGNVYLNSALAGLVELPAIAIAIAVISKVGKKWLFCGTLVAAGVSCLCAAISEGNDDILWLKITFLMIGKFTVSAANTIMPVYTAELYPTGIRNVGVGACNVAAGLALILTPYLSLLTKIESHLLMTLLTAVSLFGGLVVLFLPETMAMTEHAKTTENSEEVEK